MKEIELKTSEISSKTITNLFLYGKKTTPSFGELKNNPAIIDRENITLYISDMESYMRSYGRFANASRIEKIQYFF